MNSSFAQINLDNLLWNYKVLRKRTNTKVMAVVKADAYGHGMIECVRALSSLPNKPEYYGVALLSEAVELRKSKITKAQILCFAPFDISAIEIYQKFKIIPTITHISQIKKLVKLSLKKTIKIHVNVNTGMNRLGINYSSIDADLSIISDNKNIIIDGIYTHFATSDERDKSFANLQLKRFNEVLNNLRKSEISYGLVHAANSGAILDMEDSYFDMVRPGISLYGYYPSLETSESVKLKPVMSLHTKLSHLFELVKGESVGYGRLLFAKHKIYCGTVPFGYADGLSRNLSNKMSVIVGDRYYDQIGRISMDRISISFEDNLKKIGQKVTLLGNTKSCKIDAWDWAKLLDTIPYEITCNISKRIPRKYVRNS